MAVTVRDLDTPAVKKAAPQRTVRIRHWHKIGDWIATQIKRLVLTLGCLIGVCLALYFWFFGAGWTVNGVPLLGNILLGHLSHIAKIEPVMQIRLPLPWEIYQALWVVPVICSLDEIFGVPLRRRAKRWIWLGLGLAAVWVFVVSFDLSSTFLGLYNPEIPPGTVVWLFRGTLPGAAFSTVWFTFFPEWLLGSMLATLFWIWRS